MEHQQRVGMNIVELRVRGRHACEEECLSCCMCMGYITPIYACLSRNEIYHAYATMHKMP